MSPGSSTHPAKDAVIVAAAGLGKRFHGDLPKALEVVVGRSLLAHCLSSLTKLKFAPITLVTSPATHVAEVSDICSEFPSLNPQVVVGGVLRSDSIALALTQLPDQVERVFVHDAARAFTPPEVFYRVRDAIVSGETAVIPVLPPRDTLKEVGPGGAVVRTVDRSTIRVVQTPQGFRRRDLVRAYAVIGDTEMTDDASVMEADGHTVRTVDGDPRAFKVTDPFDRYIAEAVMATQQQSSNEEAQDG